MSKLLILLLFALVQSIDLKGKQVYDLLKMKALQNGVYEINVKVGDEFYFRFYENGSIYNGPAWWPTNTNEIPDALKAEGSEYVGTGFGKMIMLGAGGYKYYKYKALKPSTNEITLKFTGRTGVGILGNRSLAVKVNILPKDKTS